MPKPIPVAIRRQIVERHQGGEKLSQVAKELGMHKEVLNVFETLSFTDDPKIKGAPTGFRITITEARASVGAGFIYPLCGEMRTMPGLGADPAAMRVDIDENGNVVGLF